MNRVVVLAGVTRMDGGGMRMVAFLISHAVAANGYVVLVRRPSLERLLRFLGSTRKSTAYRR